MSEIENRSISEMKIGSYIMMDGSPSKITKMDRSAPGKHGHAKYRVEAVGLIDEKKRIIIMTGHDTVQVPIVEKRDAQVLSVTGDKASVMDSETYETFDLFIPEELKGQVKEGSKILFWDIVGTKVMKQVK